MYNTEMSLRTLKNRLQGMDLKRRNVDADEEEVTTAIREQLNGPGCFNTWLSINLALPSFEIWPFKHREAWCNASFERWIQSDQMTSAIQFLSYILLW
jgi:hypothetical protein